MPRFARVVVPECPHHVTQRGNARRTVFFGPSDKQVYLGLLKQYSLFYKLRILGYCLMSNHVHLIVVPIDESSLAKTMREVHGRYARYRNAIEQNTGHVWQNRYYSCAFERNRLSSVMRYVELNPLRAGLVQSAADYAWSSAFIHLGAKDPADLVDLEQWRRDWSNEEWAQLLRGGTEEPAAIREATYAGRPLGSSQFVAALEERLGRGLAATRTGRKSQFASSAAAD